MPLISIHLQPQQKVCVDNERVTKDLLHFKAVLRG